MPHQVSWSCWGSLPLYGRRFEPADAGRPVVIVSHAFGATLAGDPRSVGRPIMLAAARTPVNLISNPYHNLYSSTN
jgi:hypothetical protein